MLSVRWDDVRRRRLSRSFPLGRAGPERLVDLARDLCGVHAQVQASAELQLAVRDDGITQADVRAALWESRSLVKAWTLRGTLHLHAADELALWHAARRATVGRRELEAWRDPAGVVHPPVGLDEVESTRVAVWEALDGRCLLRDELVEEVVQRVGPKPRDRLRSGFAFFLGELCQGPPQGAKVTFVRPDQWIEGWQEVDEEVALIEACRRYLRTYGPARPGDFRQWIGGNAFGMQRARAVFDSLGDELEEIDVEGHRAYVLAEDTAFHTAKQRLRLLPEYDVYVMGFREREHFVPEPVRDRVARHARGRYEGPAGVRFVVVDGVAAGLWERRKRGRRVELTIAPARRLTKVQRAELDAETERIGAFLGLEPVVSVVAP